jgi:endonuclease III
MMALARVRAIKPKSEAIVYDKEMEKYQVLINLFLGQKCPDHLLETIATKLNKYMFTDKFKEYIKDKPEDNVF